MPNLQVNEFRNCCTAKIIYGFDGSSAAAHGNRAQPNKEELSEALKEKMEYVSRTGQGIAVAMITSEQVVAKEVLESMGWKLATESNKNNHSDTTLLCYTWAVKPDNEEAAIVNPFAKPEVVIDFSEYRVCDEWDELNTILRNIDGKLFHSSTLQQNNILQKIDPSHCVAPAGRKYRNMWQRMPVDGSSPVGRLLSENERVQHMERSWVNKPKRWVNRTDKTKNVRFAKDIPWERVALYRVVG